MLEKSGWSGKKKCQTNTKNKIRNEDKKAIEKSVDEAPKKAKTNTVEGKVIDDKNKRGRLDERTALGGQRDWRTRVTRHLRVVL